MKSIFIFSLISFCCFTTAVRAQDFSGVRDLVHRRAPWLEEHLVLKKVQFEKQGGAGHPADIKTQDHTVDAFTLSYYKGKVQIEANSPSAAAFGVHWYLKYYCHRSMSHMGDNLAPVDKLPVITRPVHLDGLAKYRYALNYCTYNYTMSFYNWTDWQRELDYMALNGVNLMLVANGQEAVWQSVLDHLGYTQKEIDAFITGPAFNAWWLMGNIQGWGGPMTRPVIQQRSHLVQKMLRRMQQLGIQPVMPAFFGMVPSSLKQKRTAHIVEQGKWGYFERPDILDPSDSLFAVISDLFYGATKQLYGKDIHFFSGDPFHEGGKHGDINLTTAGVKIQSAMQKAFPGAVWVLQGWQANPDKNLIAAVNKRDILIQELFGENTHNWEDRKGYEGTPFIWCTVTNFGERPGINGKLQRFADEIYRVRHSPYDSLCTGVGIMPEGINNNPVVYELMLELGWHKDKVDVRRWIKDYVYARYGKTDPVMLDAWDLLLKSAYSSDLGYAEGPPENILCARPALKIKSVSTWGSRTKKYDLNAFKKAVDLFAQAWPQYKDQRTYRIDLINLIMQQIGTRADSVYANVVGAYTQKDIAAFNAASKRFLSLLDDATSLLETDPFYQLSTYVHQAKVLNNNKEAVKNNVRNLMMLNTYWGGNDPKEDNLHEYAYKEWAPIMENYYKQRWVLFFNYLTANLEGKSVPPVNFFKWERNWVENAVRRALAADKETLQSPGKLSRILPQIMDRLDR